MEEPLTAKELLATSEKMSPTAERQLTIKGILLTAAESGLFGANFLREDFPDSDFADLDPELEVTQDERNTYVRWTKPVRRRITSGELLKLGILPGPNIKEKIEEWKKDRNSDQTPPTA